MQIRSGQLVALETEFWTRQCSQLVGFYRRTIPEIVTRYDDLKLIAQILAAHERGRNWGISLQDSMIRFIALDLVVAEKFDTHPDVQRLFRAQGVSIDIKVHVLADMVQNRLRRYDMTGQP